MNEASNTTLVSGDGDGEFLAMQDKVRGSNIDETTLLATDYLNHFNEIVVLLLKILADLVSHLGTSDTPLPAIDAQWSGTKHTNAEFEAMKELKPDMDEAEINLRFRAFG